MNTQLQVFILAAAILVVITSFGFLIGNFLNRIIRLKEFELDQKNKYQTDFKKQQEEYLARLFELIKPKFSGLNGDPFGHSTGPVGTSGTSGIPGIYGTNGSQGWYGSSPVFVIPTPPAPTPVEDIEIPVPLMGIDTELVPSNPNAVLKIVSLSMTNAGGVCMGNIMKKCYHDKDVEFGPGCVLYMDPLLEKPFPNENNEYKLIGTLPTVDDGDGRIYNLTGNIVGEYIGITC